MNTLHDKITEVLQFLEVGMDLYSAQMAAKCTTEEIEAMNKDSMFKSECIYKEKLMEYELLQTLNVTIANASEKGNADAIKWKLSKINPNRWGDSKDHTKDSNTSNVHIHLPDNGR